MAFKIAGRVEKRLVDEGQMVKQGEVVAVLDTADLQCNVALRQAEVETAKAALAELLAGSRIEDNDAAKAAWEKAAHALADLEAGSRPQEIAAAEAAVGRRRRRHEAAGSRHAPRHAAVPAKDDLGRGVRRRAGRPRRGRRKTSPGRRAIETCPGGLRARSRSSRPARRWPRPRPSTIWSWPARGRKTSTRAGRGWSRPRRR